MTSLEKFYIFSDKTEKLNASERRTKTNGEC